MAAAAAAADAEIAEMHVTDTKEGAAQRANLGIGAALSFLKLFFIGKVKVLRRNKSPVFSRFPPDGFPPPAHLANFVVK